jgi:negative regulator of flagellin synthesis FlgM
MTIQSLTSKTNTVVLPSKNNQAEKAKNTSIDTTEQIKDTVDITTVAKEINKASEASESSVNKEQVAAIKNAIAEGTYTINAEKIAEKMIQMEGI